MQPLIVIPVIMSSRTKDKGDSVLTTYDHATPISQLGELPRLLDSLKKIKSIGHVCILVVAENTIEQAAAIKIERLTMNYDEFNTLVVGEDEVIQIQNKAAELGLPDISRDVSLTSYGAIRNVGLALAQVFGFDSVVFLDDDEIIEDLEFMEKAMYGLGKLTKKGIPILAKTGFYLNKEGSFLSPHNNFWYDRYWQKGRLFNKWIEKAMKGNRLSRSNFVCGGCLVLHCEAFRRLSFDPYITRGEDLDYLLNLRMYGSDMWFDNKLCVRHLPPEIKNDGIRFMQDIYRWLYENRKLEYSRSQIDLLQIKPSDLDPYPGPFLRNDIMSRIKRTALLRSFGKPNKKEYRKAANQTTKEASVFAQRNCKNYFEFQRVWPALMNGIYCNKDLQEKLELAGHNRRRAVYQEMQAESDLAAAKIAMKQSNTHHNKRNIDPGETGDIRLNIAE